MATRTPDLILSEIVGFGDFPDVVVQGADLSQQAVGPDPLAGGLRQSTQNQAVVVSARRFPRKKLQELLRRIAPLQEGQRRGDPKQTFDERQQA